jgi:hypothetical protein
MALSKKIKPRGRKALGIVAERTYTAPDGTTFNTYQRCMSYTMKLRKDEELRAWLNGQPAVVVDYILTNRDKLKELL